MHLVLWCLLGNESQGSFGNESKGELNFLSSRGFSSHVPDVTVFLSRSQYGAWAFSFSFLEPLYWEWFSSFQDLLVVDFGTLCSRILTAVDQTDSFLTNVEEGLASTELFCHFQE